MEHHFNIEDAKKYGVNAAVILNNIRFWEAKNRANGVNLHDEKYWTYNSVEAYQELFPYLTADQIRYALNKLVEEGAILKGNYSENKYDRTSWYTVADVHQMHLGIFPNGSGDFPKSTISTDSKPYRKPTYEDFLNYSVAKKPNVCTMQLKLKYDSWVENGWKDGNNKPIKNWKSKILNTLPYLGTQNNSGRTISL